MNRRSFVTSIAALVPLGWFKGRKNKITHERGYETEPCPWCGNRCMFVDSANFGSAAGRVRIAADCEDHFEAYLRPRNNEVPDRTYADLEKLCDLYGNNYGRTNWCSTIEEAIAEWNDKVRRGRKTNQLGVW